MRILLAAVLIAFALPAAADEPPAPPWQAPLDQNHPLVGRIWIPAEGRYVAPEALSRRLAAADFVLLGERHDNPDHHRLQAWAMAQAIAGGRRPVVAFEMVSPDQAPALRRYQAEHPGSVEGLDSALDWKASGWPAWENYRPLFAQAVSAGLAIRPANVPHNLISDIAHGRDIPTAAASFFRLDQPLDSATATAMAEEIRDSHCGQLPEKSVPAMVNVQRARDAAMAHAMADDATGGAILIAGAGHTRTDRGVPKQLAALAPGRTVFSLAFAEVAKGEDDPAAYGQSYGAALPPFDAIWFTPRESDEDPCAGLADFMKKKKEKEKGKENTEGK